MTAFARPVIYEINTFVWLQSLSAKYGRRIDLSSVPAAEWDLLGELDCDAIWLMGVWQRSSESQKIALALPEIVSECHRVLPDFKEDDLPGSPYSIREYRVDERIGSLGVARTALAERGLKLILDFVPNHVAPDHPWVAQHPEYFIQGTKKYVKESAELYFRSGSTSIAHGRDPYFPPWTDTAQLNIFSLALRSAAIDSLIGIAEQCDGVRCDMAMLLLSDVFEKTWGTLAGKIPHTEYWTDVIGAVRQAAPGFLFIAEAYWDREWDLQQLGFDYCYDKRLYDRLVHYHASSIQSHLSGNLGYQERLIRFLENHDEERAATALPKGRHKAAAVAVATLPGALLYHDGQFCGRMLKVPVQLGRGPDEACDTDLFSFYSQLRVTTRTIKVNGSEWTMNRVMGWPDNLTASNLLSWCWNGPAARFVVVINFADIPSQGRVRLPWTHLDGRQWRLSNLLGSEIFLRDGAELQHRGLYVALDAWQYYALHLEETSATSVAVS